jgi:hypothetical protein
MERQKINIGKQSDSMKGPEPSGTPTMNKHLLQ